MSSTHTIRPALLGLASSLAVSAILLFPGLGGFGMWEPHETDRADAAQALNEGRPVPVKIEARSGVSERLVALGMKAGDGGEISARLPMAVLAALAVSGLFLLVLPLGGARLAALGGMALASAPVLLFNGRQAMAGMPFIFSETLSIGGLALLGLGHGTATAVAGSAAAAIGLAIGWLSAGLFMGVAMPAATVFTGLALRGDLPSLFRKGAPSRLRAALVLSLLAALAAGTAFAGVTVLSANDVPLVTGGLPSARLRMRTLEAAIEQIAYGWFPWSALVPVCLAGVIAPRADEAPAERSLRLLSVAGLSVGYVCQTFFVGLHGAFPCSLALPMALAVALGLRDLERGSSAARLAGLFAAVLFAIMLRDFAQRPETLLSGYGLDDFTLPKQWKPLAEVSAGCIPFVLLLVLGGFVGADINEASWRTRRVTAMAPLAALAFGLTLTQVTIPRLSVHLSSRHVLEAYERFERHGEPLGVYGRGRPTSRAATPLAGRDEAIAWLERQDRVFVMFPPSDLAEIDRRFRERTARHVFVLDAASDRFVLATSRPESGEIDQNPLAPIVLRTFDPPPPSPLEIRFEDKVTLLGWNIRSNGGERALSKGDPYTLTTYWRCDKPLGDDYRVFVHIDGAGTRLNADHTPLGGRYPTSQWRPGDHLLDVHKGTVPYYQASGTYTVRAGLFKGGTRLRISGDAGEESTRARLGTVVVR